MGFLFFIVLRTRITVTDTEKKMPAIASLEDLKAAQKHSLGIYAMLYALCPMLLGGGGK
jgi:hypothetical protein